MRKLASRDTVHPHLMCLQEYAFAGNSSSSKMSTSTNDVSTGLTTMAPPSHVDDVVLEADDATMITPPPMRPQGVPPNAPIKKREMDVLKRSLFDTAFCRM